MTTDLNKILERQDYVKMTKLLREKCDYVEGIISKKMVELELDGTDNGIFVNGQEILCVRDCLFTHTPEEESYHHPGEIYYETEYRMIKTYMPHFPDIYEKGDEKNFSFWPCANKHALRFLNNAVAIIEKLGEIEQKKAESMEKAIESVKNV